MKITFHVVQTPTGDRPYVSIREPKSYIEHLDASGDKAEVYAIEIELANDLSPGQCLIGCDCGVFASKLTRLR